MTTLEERSRRLLRAWPAIDRAERGDEIVATTLDLVSPGRSRLPMRLVASLLLGGLRARHRARPTCWRWFLYALFSFVPKQGCAWVADDVVRPGFLRRRFVRSYAAQAIVDAAAFVVLRRTGSGPLLSWVVFMLALQLHSRLWPPEGVMKRAATRLMEAGDSQGALRVGRQLLLRPRRSWAGRALLERLAWVPPEDLGRAEARVLGEKLLEAGYVGEAIELLAGSYEQGRRLGPSQHATWQAGRQLAQALDQAGRLDEARRVWFEVASRKTWLHGSPPG